MKKRIAALLSMAMLCTTLFATGASAEVPRDEVLEIERVDVATGEVSQYTVQADESTPSVLMGTIGTDPLSQDVEIEPYNVIGPDNRYEVKNPNQIPYRFMCYTVTNFHDGFKKYGTAFMIGPNKVATSAYNLYDPAHGGRAKNIAVAPARNGESAPYGYLHSTAFEYPTKYATAADAGDAANKQLYDIGCVTLSQNLGNQCGYFNMRSIAQSDFYVGKSITVAGYPENIVNGKPLPKLNKSAGTVSAGNTAYLYYTMDTSYGQSGGPVYIEENGIYYAVGVHNYGSATQNGARKFTPTVMEWFQTH